MFIAVVRHDYINSRPISLQLVFLKTVPSLFCYAYRIVIALIFVLLFTFVTFKRLLYPGIQGVHKVWIHVNNCAPKVAIELTW